MTSLPPAIRVAARVLLACGLAATGARAAEPEPTRLQPGARVERTVALGETHRYRVDLPADQYVEIVCSQLDAMDDGVDVALTLLAPDGAPLLEVDGPDDHREVLAFTAPAAGTYELRVKANSVGATPRYVIELAALRDPCPADLARVRAVRAQADALREHSGRPGAPGDMRAAQADYLRSIDDWREAGDAEMETWSVYMVGVIHRLFFDEFRESMPYLELALTKARQTGDRLCEGKVLFNLGTGSWRLGEFDDARRYFEEALALHRASGFTAKEAYILLSLGRLFTASGDYQQALDRLHEGRALYRRGGTYKDETDFQGVAQVYLGNLHVELGDYDQALAEFRAAQPRVAGFAQSEVRVATGIGAALHGLGDLPGAEAAYREALAAGRRLDNRALEAETTMRLAELRRDQGDLPGAHALYASALEAFVAQEVHLESAARCGLAEVERRQGRAEEAAAKFREALADRRGTPAVVACAEEGLARLAADAGDLAGAVDHAERALRAAELLRTAVANAETRQAALAAQQSLYALLVGLRMRQHAADPLGGHDAAALAVAEAARARSLIELLAEARVDVREGVPDAVLQQERGLGRRLNLLAREREQAVADKRTARAEALDGAIARVTDDLDEIEARVRRASPRYAALTRPQPLDLAAIQRDVLDDDTLLLEYALGDDESYLWAVSRTDVHSYRLGPRAPLEQAARAVYEHMARPAAAADEAARLSRMLLAPAADVLGSRRLLVVAPGMLEFLPFGALPDPRTLADPSPAPLLVAHEIVRAPSASVVDAIRRETDGRPRATRVASVLADPVYERTDPRLIGRAAPEGAADPSGPLAQALHNVRGGGSTALGRLPFSRREAHAIAALAPRGSVRTALGFAASRETALSPALADARIVHLAAHGLLDTQRPDLSGIVLSLFDERGRPRDGFLRLHDVFNLRLSADLVVLSGCETGLGRVVQGEGLVGLTRGFMYAGARSVLASLWPVDDRATAELMTRFYTRLLRDHRPPAAALRAAQVEMSRAREWREPFYWAGFVLQGEWR